jgi:hypothetical protein
MMNLANVVLSPMLNSQPITVHRKVGSFVAGRWVEEDDSPPTFETTGIIYPSTQKELLQVPEGDRVSGAMTFLTTREIKVTHKDSEAGLSDKIEWNGELYKVLSVFPWKDYGYWSSICERISGA